MWGWGGGVAVVWWMGDGGGCQCGWVGWSMCVCVSARACMRARLCLRVNVCARAYACVSIKGWTSTGFDSTQKIKFQVDGQGFDIGISGLFMFLLLFISNVFALQCLQLTICNLPSF